MWHRWYIVDWLTYSSTSLGRDEPDLFEKVKVLGGWYPGPRFGCQESGYARPASAIRSVRSLASLLLLLRFRPTFALLRHSSRIPWWCACPGLALSSFHRDCSVFFVRCAGCARLQRLWGCGDANLRVWEVGVHCFRSGLIAPGLDFP
jgi:hypothetical protein